MTAVEWLVSKLNKNGFAKVVTDEEIEEAKEIEKQQIIDANKCYHPLTERKHTSDTHFECTICGYNNY